MKRDQLSQMTAGDTAQMSDAMRCAVRCLGGARTWTGDVSGIFGFIRRSFVISSIGSYSADGLIFEEALEFDDGEFLERRWRLFDAADGLDLEAENIKLLKPGRIEDGVLMIDYKMTLGPIRAAYADSFLVDDNGGVVNRGRIMIFGSTIMNVNARTATTDGRFSDVCKKDVEQHKTLG